jgi:hypothetical protein
MNKLSKDKRNQLILVAMLTVGVIAGLWFGLIAMQKQKITEISQKLQDTQAQIDRVQTVVTGTAQVEAGLKIASERLYVIENGMPSGDLFSWIVRTIKTFNNPAYKVEMPQFGIPVVNPVSMLPNFPYSQSAVAVSGNAYYSEFGRFLSDFENHFPYMRVQNLSLEPGGGTTPEEREKLAFHMEIVTLVKANSP